LTASTEESFPNFIKNLIFLFNNKPILLSKSEFIIKKLSLMLDPEKIFREISNNLLIQNRNNFQFYYSFIQILNNILLTSKEFSTLKNLIKESETKKNGLDLFIILFKSWSYNPISTLSLCLLSKNYFLSSELISNL
jgi:vacuole morphology and inheritance protein 14